MAGGRLVISSMRNHAPVLPTDRAGACRWKSRKPFKKVLTAVA